MIELHTFQVRYFQHRSLTHQQCNHYHITVAHLMQIKRRKKKQQHQVEERAHQTKENTEFAAD